MSPRASGAIRSSWLRIVLVILASAWLLLIFSAPPVRLKCSLTHYARRPAVLKGESKDLLSEEHKKAIDEIQKRIEQEDAWYRYKFVVAGALILAFLGKMLFQEGEKHEGPVARLFGRHGSSDSETSSRDDPEGRLANLFGSNTTLALLALVCVVAVTIDIHIRSSIGVMHQLGSWLAYYVEPARLQVPFNPRDANLNASKFLPWEQFLRIDLPEAGMHGDEWYRLLFEPHLHFLTFVIYLAYLWVLQEICLGDRPQTRWLIMAGFVIVHLSLLTFAVISHSAPRAFESKLLFYDVWLSGAWSWLPYAALVPLLAALALPYLRLLFGFHHLFDCPKGDKWKMTTAAGQPDGQDPGHFKLVGCELEAVAGSIPGVYWCAEPTPADFILRLEWQCRREGAGSGVFVRFPDPDTMGYENTAYVAKHFGLVVKINHGGDEEDRVICNCPARRAADASSANPSAGWNKLEIRVQGQCYSVLLNGAAFASYAFQVGSDPKHPDRGLPSSRQQPRYIGLQTDVGGVAFRDIQVKGL